MAAFDDAAAKASDVDSATAPGQLDIPPVLDDKTAHFSGRSWLFRRLDSWLSSDDGGPFLLVGGPGSGKTTIATRWAQLSNGTTAAADCPHLGQGFLTYAHFCRAKDPSVLPLNFIAGLSSRLAGMHAGFRQALLAADGRGSITISGEATAGSVAAGGQNAGVVAHIHIHDLLPERAFEEAIARPLRSLGPDGIGTPITVLVDALDEALIERNRDHLPGFLSTAVHSAAALPGPFRFILTARRDPRILDRFHGLRVDLAEDMPPDVDDVLDYALRRLRDLPEPGHATVAARVAAQSGGNFLYAHHVIDDLLHRPGKIDDPETFPLPPDLAGIYREFLQRELAPDRVDEHWRKEYRPVLGLLAIARGDGLSVRQIAGAARTDYSLAADILQSCAQFLSSTTPEGPVRIYHESFRDFLISDKDFSVYPGESCQALARYLVAEWSGNWERSDDHSLAYTPSYLADAADAARSEAAAGKGRDDLDSATGRSAEAEWSEALAATLTDVRFLEAKVARFGPGSAVTDLEAAAVIKNPTAAAELAQLHDILVRESHHLQGWSKDRMPAYLAQQLSNAARRAGSAALAQVARRRLAELNHPYLLLSWQTGEESTALIRTLGPHSDRVFSVAVTPDGHRAICGCVDGTLRVWEPDSGRDLHTLPAEGRFVRAVAITPDGRRAISAADNGALKVWDLDTGENLSTWRADSSFSFSSRSVAISPDGRLAVSAADSHVSLWDIEAGQEPRKLARCDDIVLNMIMIAADDGRALWVTQDGIVGTARLDASGPDCDFSTIAAADWDRSREDRARFLRCAAVAADAQIAVAVSARRERDSDDNRHEMLHAGDLASGRELWSVAWRGGMAKAVAVEPAGRLAVTASDDASLKVWDLHAGTMLRTLHGHGGSVNDVSLASQRNWAVSASDDGTLKVWDLLSRGEPGQPARGHRQAVWGMAATTDGRMAVSASQDETVKVWDLASGRELGVLRGEGGPVVDVAVSPDDRLVVTGSSDGAVRIWRLRSGRLKARRFVGMGVISAVAVSPDGRHVIAGSSYGGIAIWRLGARGLAPRPWVAWRGHAAVIRSVKVTPDSRRVVSACDDGLVKVWDIHAREQTAAFEGSGSALGMTIAGDGRRAVSVYSKDSLMVWDLDAGNALHALEGHADTVWDVAAMADGRHVASVSADRTIKVWDLSSYSEVASFPQGGEMQAMAVTPDGSRIVAGDRVGRVTCVEFTRGVLRAPAGRTGKDRFSRSGRFRLP